MFKDFKEYSICMSDNKSIELLFKYVSLKEILNRPELESKVNNLLNEVVITSSGKEHNCKDVLSLMECIDNIGIDKDKVYFNTTMLNDLELSSCLTDMWFTYIIKGIPIRLNYLNIILNNDLDASFNSIKRVIDSVNISINRTLVNKEPDNADRDLSLIFNFMANDYKFSIFEILKKELKSISRKAFVEIGQSIYISTLHGCNVVSKELIEELFAEPEKELIKDYGDMPFVIYRGVGSKSVSLDEASSWTTNFDTALDFALRFVNKENQEDLNSRKIYAMTVTCADIAGRGAPQEHEVIVKHESLVLYIDDEDVSELHSEHFEDFKNKDNWVSISRFDYDLY